MILTRIRYNASPTLDCYKHEILLGYDTDPVTAPWSMSLIDNLVVTRFHELTDVTVNSTTSCGSSVALRRYHLKYQPDADTAQPRLSSVVMYGRADRPDGATPVPVASYQYGSATHGGQLAYELTQSVALPVGADTSMLSSSVADPTLVLPADSFGVGYATWQSLTDVTGDGRPDFVYKQGNQLVVAANLPGSSGTTLLGGAVPLTNLTPGPFEKHASTNNRFAGAYNEDQVWREAIDMNGDGRVDFIDASEEANSWVVYLNTPGPTTVETVWVPHDPARRPLHAHERARPGGKFRLHSAVEPLHRLRHPVQRLRQVGHRSEKVGRLHRRKQAAREQHGYGTEETFTEWELKDINGDGFPDVVMNGSPVGWTVLPDDPRQDGQANEVLHLVRTNHFGPTGYTGNHVDVAYNVTGVLFGTTPGFAAPVAVRQNQPCGVEEWTSADLQVVSCGFADVNGDGLIDRVEDHVTNPFQVAYLGTGSGFTDVNIPLTGGALSVQSSEHKWRCPTDPPIDPATLFGAWQSKGMRDLTGDGIPDYLVQDASFNWTIAVGTGAGFAPPVPIAMPMGAQFSFSSEGENCGGTSSRTGSGIFDVDGDGLPDVVYVDHGSLDVFQLAGGVAARDAEAGRLRVIDNGYGAVTTIGYRSAKEDGSTHHQVPSPEMVVSSVETTKLAKTLYAYGGADMYYDSARARFAMIPYNRTISLRVTGTANDARVLGTATITDSYPLAGFDPAAVAKDRYGRYLRAGRPSDVTVLAGALPSDVWSMLNETVANDGRRISSTHYDVGTRAYVDTMAGDGTFDCLEMMFPYDFITSLSDGAGSSGLDVCSVHGFAYTYAVNTWRGSAAPPSTSNVQTRTTVRSVDDYGRPLSVYYENDATRSDDDYCIDTEFAVPTGSEERVLSAPSTRKVWGCGVGASGGVSNAVYALDRYEYDQLAGGSVTMGFLTGHTVERHATDDGTLLGTFRDFDKVYDSFGNVTQILRTRQPDGAAQNTLIDYDSFELAPVHVASGGTNVPTLETFVWPDPVSLEATSVTDPTGTVRGKSFDAFGRMLTTTIQAAGGHSGVMSTASYLGFAGGDSLGRRVVLKTFTDAVDSATAANAPGRTGTTFLDELGRPVVTQVALGGDYGGETLITGARTYDSLGRVVFEADPYPASQDPTTAYGTSRSFSADGSLQSSIRGRGPQPASMTVDDSAELYPTWFTHSFANYQESMSVQDAASLTPGSSQSGVVEATITSAVGRLLFRSAWRGGARLEHAAFNQSVIGQLSAITRYQDPVNAANAVQWTLRKDSLDEIVQVTEPVALPQTRSYSSFGDLLSVVTGGSNAVVYGYDAFGRVTHSEEQTGGGTDPTTVNDYTYDTGITMAAQVTPTYVAGRLASATSPTGSEYFSYDGLGRVNARVFADPGDTMYVEQHTLHDDGSEATTELDLPDNGYLPERVDYGYDSAGRTRSMLFSDGSSTLPLYKATTVDPFGRVREAQLAKTSYAAAFSDVGRRLPQEVKVVGASDVRYLSFDHWDSDGRELARTEENPVSPGSTGMAYDALGRLASSTTTNGGSQTANWSYSYDPLGNLTKLSDLVGVADATLTYQTVDRDRICRAGYGNNPTVGKGCTVTYDSYGNVIGEPARAGFRKLSYFNGGQVREIDDSQGTAAFRYDAFGALQQLNVWASSGVRTDQHYGAHVALRGASSNGYSTSYVSRKFAGPGVSISRRGAKGPWIFEVGGVARHALHVR